MKKARKMIKIEYRPMPCCVCGEPCEADEVISFDIGTQETAHMRCREKK